MKDRLAEGWAIGSVPLGRKGKTMTPFKTVSEKLSVWRRYREAVRELAQLSDYELHDIRVLRADIEFIARRPSADKATGRSSGR
jgi:uncharacterized protein YjiS (DUF1127 family)